MAQTFMSGFMRGSLLQMAVCSPPREAATRRVDAVYIAQVGEKVDARSSEAPQPAAPQSTVAQLG